VCEGVQERKIACVRESACMRDEKREGAHVGVKERVRARGCKGA